ncbi:subtilisin-like protease [Auricularia subglabra TFB-10046 SS5]|nr:subtilisin-like protease [Auricularia subglabra TFB-10046 SS5]
MRVVSVACTIAGLSSAVLGARLKLSDIKPNFPDYVEGKFIVELTSADVLNGKREDVHARFFDELDKRLPPKAWSSKKIYDSDVFVGAALTLTNPDDIAKLGAIKGVKALRPVIKVPSPEIRLGSLPNQDALNIPADLFPPNVMTGVDRIHALGNKGKGIKIGMCALGVDYNHPALGGGFGPGHKVIGGYDFVGDDYLVGYFPAVPDDDPHSNCNGHGTHVAGILGANPSNAYNITGVAYEASLNAYRVFGCFDGTDDALIVEALIRAYEDGNDIITLSLGGVDGWTEGTSSVIASRIADRGRVLTVAAGNAGEHGAWYSSYPANGINVISVSSTNNIVTGPLQAARTSVPHDPILYATDGNLAPLPIEGEWPIYATSREATVEADACVALPDSTPDLSTFVTLVRRGGCNFDVKLANIAAKGGQNVLFYNNGGVFGRVATGSATAAMVQEADGVFLLEHFLAGTALTVSFPKSGSFGYVPNDQTGGLVSAFTSYGPSYDMHFKPAVAAPGGGIISTWPLDMGGFAMSSGTSMATPHVAGVAALILKARGKGAVKGLRDLLETTSQSIPQSVEEGAIPHTLIQAGAGQLNVHNALTYQTVVTPGELLLNDTANWKGAHTIWIHNTARKARTYTLKHVPAGTAVTLAPGSIQPAVGPVPQDNAADSQARVRLALSRITVPAGMALPVLVSIQPPKNAPTVRLPVVSGHIVIATAGETLRVSYLGAATALKSVQVVDNTDEMFGLLMPLMLSGSGELHTDDMNYTFVSGDAPGLIWRQTFGSASVKLDLVAHDIDVLTNLKKRGTGAWSWWWPGIWRPRPGSSFAAVPTLGPLWEHEYTSRNAATERLLFSAVVPGTFANGTAIPYGRFRALFRVLKVAGDASRQEDYETWLSPIIGVVPPA